MNYFEDETLPSILANEAVARVYLNGILDMGVKIDREARDLSHNEVIELVLQLLSELKRRERP